MYVCNVIITPNKMTEDEIREFVNDFMWNVNSRHTVNEFNEIALLYGRSCYAG